MENITEKKKAIFESTLELVREHGFHGCPMSAVAKNAGVAAGTIYHYFEGKDQLIRGLHEYVSSEMIEAMLAGDSGQQPFKKRYFRLWRRLYDLYVRKPGLIQFFQQYINSPYNVHEREPGHDHVHEVLFDFHREGVKAGHLRDVNPEILGLLTHRSIITAAKIHGFGKIPIGEKELAQITQVLWDGMSTKS